MRLSISTVLRSDLKLPITDIAAVLLILLFVYTAVSKVLDFQNFKNQINNQALPEAIKILVVWTLPSIEIITSIFLIFKNFRLIGFWLSATLMTAFTIYIAMVIFNFFERVPCSCGGVLKILGWKAHLVFNLFFLLLSFLGIYLTNRERRHVGNE